MQSYHLIIKTKLITIFVKLTLSEINMKDKKKDNNNENLKLHRPSNPIPCKFEHATTGFTFVEHRMTESSSRICSTNQVNQ